MGISPGVSSEDLFRSYLWVFYREFSLGILTKDISVDYSQSFLWEFLLKLPLGNLPGVLSGESFGNFL